MMISNSIYYSANDIFHLSLFCEECHWYFDENCIECENYFGEYGHFNILILFSCAKLLKSVIPTTHEVEIRRISVGGWPMQKVKETPSQTNKSWV
jgi:hypothetical protein